MYINNYNILKINLTAFAFFYLSRFVCVFLVLFLFSCSTVDKKYLEENRPTVSFHSVNLESINSEAIDFTLNLKIKNNYNFDIILTKLNIDIKSRSGTQFASISKDSSAKDKPIKIKSLESDIVGFYVSGKYSGLIETLVLFFTNNKIELYTEGESYFKYKGFKIKVPIKTQFEIDTSKI